MSSPHKRCRGAFTATPPPPPPPVLPSDLVLEIVARSDVATLLRCAACCKSLRRDILRPAFIRRVCRGQGAGVPPHLLCLLQCPRWFYPATSSQASPPPLPHFSLAHPATPAAAYLSERHLAPFVSRSRGAADLLARYEPVTSRCGLVVLLRRDDTMSNVPREMGICVYDPMSGDRAFLPDPPEMAGYWPGDGFRTYVLLTASDGIGCSFLLLAVDFNMLAYPAGSIEVLTVSSPDAGGGGEWSPVSSVATHRRSRCTLLHIDCSAVVIGGAVHWVMHGGRDHLHVLTYDVRAAAAGSIELPMDRFPESYREGDGSLRLASSSPDGKLTVLVRDRLKISVWRLLSTGAAGWERHAVIDTEATLRSLALDLPPSWPWADEEIVFESLGERSGVLLFELLGNPEERRFALDVETKEMHMVNRHRQENIQAFPFEVDLESRLSAMKTF